MTQQQLSQQIGLSIGYVSKVLGGHREPTLDIMDAMCATFGLTPAYFFGKASSEVNATDASKEVTRASSVEDRADLAERLMRVLEDFASGERGRGDGERERGIAERVRAEAESQRQATQRQMADLAAMLAGIRPYSPAARDEAATREDTSVAVGG